MTLATRLRESVQTTVSIAPVKAASPKPSWLSWMAKTMSPSSVWPFRWVATATRKPVLLEVSRKRIMVVYRKKSSKTLYIICRATSVKSSLTSPLQRNTDCQSSFNKKVINTSCKAHIFSINFANSEEQRAYYLLSRIYLKSK